MLLEDLDFVVCFVNGIHILVVCIFFKFTIMFSPIHWLSMEKMEFAQWHFRVTSAVTNYNTVLGGCCLFCRLNAVLVVIGVN